MVNPSALLFIPNGNKLMDEERNQSDIKQTVKKKNGQYFALIVIVVVAIVTIAYTLSNRTPKLPPISEATIKSNATQKSTGQFQGTESGQYLNSEESVGADLWVTINGNRIDTYKPAMIDALAEMVSTSSAVFESQKFISLQKLLQELDILEYTNITITGYRGLEEIALPYTKAEIEAPSNLPTLVATRVPSWKLLHLKDGDLPTGNPSDLELRIVTNIDIQTK